MNEVTLNLYMESNGITWRWESALVNALKIDKIM